jgi:hypothetical protein
MFGLTLQKLLGFYNFNHSLGMLLAIANATKFAQNCLNLPKIAKIYPKTISLRNFEIPPKIEILVFLRKKNYMCRTDTKACAHRLDFQYKNFPYAFFNVKKRPLYVNFSISLSTKWHFSQGSIRLMGVRFCSHVLN